MKTKIFNTKWSVSLVLLLMTTLSFSQQGINYQGVARDANNEIIISQEIDLKLNINKTSVDGETVYSETHNPTTDINGVFSLVIGQGTPILNVFEDINWAEDKHFLNVWLDGQEVGATEFMATPYANAIGKWQAYKNGVIPKGTGGSIFIGEETGINDDFSGNNNIGVGLKALKETTTGNNNVALGPRALTLNRNGDENIALGALSLYNNISGSSNIGIGSYALSENISGDKNIAIGELSMHFGSGGNNNIALGEQTLYNNTIGEHNLANGSEALFNNSSGSFNTAIGYKTLFSNTEGEYNVANGYEALYNNTTGTNNIASGLRALYKNTEGNSNLALGYRSLRNNKTGEYNIALGFNSLLNADTGNDNIAIGSFSMFFNNTGNFNVAIGEKAGYTSRGDKNVFLGYNAGFNDEGSNKLYIENSSSLNPLIYGEFDNDILGFNAEVGIGTHIPQAPLHVLIDDDVSLGFGTGSVIIGNAAAANLGIDSNEIQARNAGLASNLYLQQNGGDVYVGNAIVHSSDRRLKRDIKDISYGLDEVLKLRPTEYFWKGKTQNHKSLGLIAQEVNDIIKNVVTYNEEQDKYGVSYTELIPVLIKAIQEQNKIIEAQSLDNNNLKAQAKRFEERLSALEGLSKANN
ncbi:hypothetical protein FBALC1_09497 [Flavobacteriales bacterium ALC-1]|nr:hypothetical protein FBALC1_09497 [Flavobacteriales bacterium ALC-1]